MILFDPATARDVVDALRLLEGRLIGTPRRIAAGTSEIRRIAERSLVVSSDHAVADPDHTPDADPMSELLDTKAAARFLSVSVSTVRRLIRTGELRYRRVGRLLRFSVDDLVDYSDRSAV